jgi:hypothetical protein
MVSEIASNTIPPLLVDELLAGELPFTFSETGDVQ